MVKSKKAGLANKLGKLVNPDLKSMERGLKPGETLETYHFFSNLFLVAALFVGLGTLGTITYRQQMQKQMSRLERELAREKEYKEVSSFSF